MNNRLLEVMSSKGKMSLDEYDKAFNYLFSDSVDDGVDIKFIRRAVLRFMEELGHCEVDYQQRRIYCCEPSLVLLPGAGLRRAVLAGGRVAELVEELKRTQNNFGKNLSLELSHQFIGNVPFPSLIRIEASSNEILMRICRELGIRANGKAPASWLLAHASGSIEEYQQTLSFESDSELNWFSRLFDTQLLCFTTRTKSKRNPSNKVIEYTNPANQQKFHRWIREEKAATVDREWGRYLALKYDNVDALFYNEKTNLLAIPAFVPLPRILARATAMCSGKIPKRLILLFNSAEKMQFDIYEGVTKTIALLIAEKVGQRLIKRSLIITDEGEIRC